MPPKGVKVGGRMMPQLGPLSEEYEFDCLRRAQENEEAIPLVELLEETMHPALELTGLRTGPTPATAGRKPLIIETAPEPLTRFEESAPAITRKPRRRWPPGMTPAVARSLGLA